MKRSCVLGVFFGLAAVSALAQVNITGQQSADKALTSLQVSINTMDRNVVPLQVESRQTQVDETTTRAASITRARLNDGSYFDFRATAATTFHSDSNTTATIIETAENDRQGGGRTTGRATSQTKKTLTGEQSDKSTYRRDSSGNLVLDGQVASTTTLNPDGSLGIVNVETRADVNGSSRTQKQIEQIVIERGANEKQVVNVITTPNHMDGSLNPTSRETATIHTDGNTTRTEKLIQQPTGAGWKDVGRIVTTETRDVGGSVRRETVEEGKSLYARRVEDAVEPLVPQRKIVESEIRSPDGTVSIERSVYRVDINGDWKPASFSTEPAVAAAFQPTTGTFQSDRQRTGSSAATGQESKGDTAAASSTGKKAEPPPEPPRMTPQ